MRKEFKLLFLANAIISIAFALVALFILPKEITLGFYNSELKSNLFLILLSLLPVVTTFLFSITEQKPIWAIVFFIAIELYSLIVVLGNLGFAISMEPIIFAVLTFSCIIIAAFLQKGKISIKLPWIQSEENKEKVNKFCSNIFIVLALIFASNTICRPFNFYSQAVAVFSALGFGFVSILFMLFRFRKKT